MAVDGHDWGLCTMGSDDNDTPSPAARPLELSAGQRERLTQLLYDELDRAYEATGMTDAQIAADVQRRRARLKPPGAVAPTPDLPTEDVVDDLHD
jgi:hypothetical protein